MNREKPLVSICIPTYNGADFIRSTIDCVLKQTYKNLEIIFSDDGSTDDTVDIISEVSDHRIKIIKNNNHGLVGNFHNCINAAYGKYVKVLCQDDLIFDDAIERETEFMEANPNISVVTGSSYIINSDGKRIVHRQVYKSDKVIRGLEFAQKTMSGRNIYSEPSIVLFRTDLAKKSGMFTDENVFYCTDWDACLLISYLGDVGYLSEPVGAFRISVQSTTGKLQKSKDKKMYSSSVELYRKHMNIGKLKLGKIHYAFFLIKTKLSIFLRSILIKIINKN